MLDVNNIQIPEWLGQMKSIRHEPHTDNERCR
jgi:hypothetical protein